MQLEWTEARQSEDFLLKVLVVDDDEAFRHVVAESLRARGYYCRVASDGLEGWTLQQQDPAHVILCDWRMPVMDGVDFCRRMREAERPNYTHFVLLSAFTAKENFLEAMRAGADDYLEKPLDL